MIMYADRITDSMQYAIDETNRRRAIQMEYNERMGITRPALKRPSKTLLRDCGGAGAEEKADYDTRRKGSLRDVIALIQELEEEMYRAAQELNFERAAELR